MENAIRSMTPDELARTGTHPRGPAYSVEDVLRRFISHDESHAVQIQSIRERIGR